MKEWEAIKKTYKGIQDLLVKNVDAPEELQLMGYMFTYFDFIVQGFEDEQKFKLKEIRLMTLKNKNYRVEKCRFSFASNWFSVDFTLEHGKSESWALKYNKERKVWEISVRDLMIYYVNSDFREFLQNIVQKIEEMVNEYEKRINALCEEYNINELLVKRALEENKFEKR